MIKIENIEVMGFEPALRGMRLPHNSGDKSDSGWKLLDEVERYIFEGEYTYNIGENDLKLAKQLSKAGTDHSKYLRMITVYMDITAPLYWIAEHDTYKVGTVRNSCSFMHKGISRPFCLEDFTIEIGSESYFSDMIVELNRLRSLYLETKDFKYFRLIRQLLPQGYNQKYTWSANYQVLKNIYHARKNHRLPEWRAFCEEIKNLPYFEELCIDM